MSVTYNVYRDDEKVASGLNNKTFTDTDLTPSTEYKYHITAENEHGESEKSNTITVTTEEETE